MAKIRQVPSGETTFHYYYNCPGCGYEHAFSPDLHIFSGDFDNPTVAPSLLHNNPQNYRRCHSFIEDGMIKFLNDCHHNLKGQTIELPEYGSEDL